MIPARLRRGDEVRVVSPAVSLGFIPEDQQQTTRERLEALGLRLSFSRNAEVMDRFDSSPVEARVSDLHEAFADPGVRGMLTTLGHTTPQFTFLIGGYGSLRAGDGIVRLSIDTH